MWRPITLTRNLETRLSKTQLEFVFHEFINNSVHFSLAIVVIEILVSSRSRFEIYMHTAVLMIGALGQAYFIGSSAYFKNPRYFIGNLICVSIYLLYISAVYGLAAVSQYVFYQLFIIYSLLIGIFQELGWRVKIEPVRHLMILAEHFTRVIILMLPFWILHAISDHNIMSWSELTNNPYYIYLIVILCLYGFLIGMSNINSYRYYKILKSTTTDLKKYSEWLLGPTLLNKSVSNPEILKLHLVDRSVLFMDIRGFTKWSSSNQPDKVVKLINNFFQVSENVLNELNAIKIELTGDEVMAVFHTPETALYGAVKLMETVQPCLEEKSLNVGIGINTGPVIEGLVGGKSLKKFSVIGNTVNIGKRICDVAKAGEILIDETSMQYLDDKFHPSEIRHVFVKGRSKKLKLFLMSPEELPFYPSENDTSGNEASKTISFMRILKINRIKLMQKLIYTYNKKYHKSRFTASLGSTSISSK